MAKAAKAVVGHNGGDTAEQDRKVLFFMNRNAYVKALAAKKAADAALKQVGKTIKADLGEHGMAQIKAYEQLQTPEGQEKLRAKLEAEAQAMRFAGLPVGTQLDMLEERAPDRLAKAYRDGEESGLRGETLSNPFNEASEEGMEYARGWTVGQQALGAGIKKKEAEGSTDELIQSGDVDEDPFADAA